jgi:hypothetical protein
MNHQRFLHIAITTVIAVSAAFCAVSSFHVALRSGHLAHAPSNGTIGLGDLRGMGRLVALSKAVTPRRRPFSSATLSSFLCASAVK